MVRHLISLNHDQTDRNELAKETCFKFCPGICVCLLILLILTVVGAVFTDWEEACIEHYTTVYQKNGPDEKVLNKVCWDNSTMCGLSECECQTVSQGIPSSSPFCESPTLEATGGWGLPIFGFAFSTFLLLCCCSPCLIGLLMCYKAQHREPGPYDAALHNGPATSTPAYPTTATLPTPVLAEAPTPISVEDSARGAPVIKLLNQHDAVPAAAAMPSHNNNTELPMATAQPIKD